MFSFTVSTIILTIFSAGVALFCGWSWANNSDKFKWAVTGLAVFITGFSIRHIAEAVIGFDNLPETFLGIQLYKEKSALFNMDAIFGNGATEVVVDTVTIYAMVAVPLLVIVAACGIVSYLKANSR